MESRAHRQPGIAVPPAPPVDRAGRLDADVACVNCGYNLRALEPTGVCPECAHPVTKSLEAHSPHSVAPGWIQTCADGAWLISAGFTVASVTLLIVLPTLLLFAVWLPGGSIFAIVPCVILGLLSAPVCILLGTVAMTTPDPRQPNDLHQWNLRFALRISPLIGLGSLAAGILAALSSAVMVKLIATLLPYVAIVVLPPTLLLMHTSRLIKSVGGTLDIYLMLRTHWLLATLLGLPILLAPTVGAGPAGPLLSASLILSIFGYVAWLVGMSVLFYRVMKLLTHVRHSAYRSATDEARKAAP